MRCSPRWVLTLAAALALVVPGCGIRHSQSYLAKRAAVAAAKQTAHASRRNITLAQAPPAGSAARGVQAAQPRRQRQTKAQAFGGGGGGYPSGITAVLKAMRREEEEAADGSAPELPPDIATTAKTCPTRYGSMAYRTIQRKGAAGGLDVVFVHGLATDGSNCQPPPEAVAGGRRWIIPELIGHGGSSLSHDPYAYRMDMQAAAIAQVLRAEGVARCAIIAHSLGAVVAVSLCEILQRDATCDVSLLLSCEGNLDTEDDAFHARMLYRGIIHRELWAPLRSHQLSAVMYWSIVWMMRECASASLLPRLTALCQGRSADGSATEVDKARDDRCGARRDAGGVDVRFVYGTKRRKDTGARR